MSDLKNLRQRSQRHLVQTDDITQDRSSNDQSKVPSASLSKEIDNAKSESTHLHDDSYLKLVDKAQQADITNPSADNKYTTPDWISRFMADFLTKSKTVTSEWIFRQLRIATIGVVPAELILQGKSIDAVSAIIGKLSIVDDTDGSVRALEFGNDGMLYYGGKAIARDGDFLPLHGKADNASLLNNKNFDVNNTGDTIVIRDANGNIFVNGINIEETNRSVIIKNDTILLRDHGSKRAYHVSKDVFKEYLGQATDTEMGQVKIYGGLGENTDGGITQAGIKTLFQDLANVYLGINDTAKDAVKLKTSRLINGTYFDGASDITTDKWGKDRYITIGNKRISWDGGSDVSFELKDIGACSDLDPRLSDAREWIAEIISQSEAEAGEETLPRKWTAERVKQAIHYIVPEMTLEKYLPYNGEVTRTGKLIINGEAIHPTVAWSDETLPADKKQGIYHSPVNAPTESRLFGYANIASFFQDQDRGFEATVASSDLNNAGLWFRRFHSTHHTDGVSEWDMAYSLNNPPSKSEVGLGKVNDWGATSSLTDDSADKYSTAKAASDLKKLITAIDEGQVIFLTKDDAAVTYLGIEATSVNSDKLDNRDSTQYMQRDSVSVSDFGSAYKTVAKVANKDLSTKFLISARGTSSSGVVSFTATVVTDHPGEATITGLCGGYTSVTVNVLTSGNGDCYVQLKGDNPNPMNLTVSVYALSGEVVTVMDGGTIPDGYTSAVEQPLYTDHETISKNLYVKGQIKEKGQRVFSPNNRNISDSTDSSSSTVYASSKAVKTVKDMFAGYFTKTEADARFLGINANAVSATIANGLASLDTRATDYKPNERKSNSQEFVFTDKGNPTSNWYSKLVMTGWGSNNNTVWELASRADANASDNKLYFRTGRGASWSNWDMVYTTRNKPTAADVGAITQAIADTRYLGIGAKAVSAGIADRLINNAMIADHVKVFVNDGHGNLGIRFNTTQAGNTAHEAGSAYEIEMDNDSNNGSFRISGAYNLSAGATFTWTKLFELSSIGDLWIKHDVTARLFRSTYANQASIGGAIAFRVNNSNDNYIRFCSDKAAILSWIGASGESSLFNYLNNAASGGLSRTARTTVRRVNGNKVYEVASTTFKVGDTIEIVCDKNATCTLNIVGEKIHYPNGASDSQLVISSSHTAKIIKQDSVSWRLVYVYTGPED